MDSVLLMLRDWKVVASALVAIFIVAINVYFNFHFNYWKRRGCPDLPLQPKPFFGHLFKLIVGWSNFTDTFDELYKTAGDRPFVGFFLGPRPSLLIKDPELIKHILVKDFHVFVNRSFGVDEDVDELGGKGLFNLKGQRWKEMRARLSPTFTSGRMKAMFPLMHACSDDLVRCLTENIQKCGGEAEVEVKELMSCFSIDVIATCAFGIQCDALQNPKTSEFRRMGKMIFEINWKRAILLALLFIHPRSLKWLGLKFTNDETSIFFRNFVMNMVKQRETEIEKRATGDGSTKKLGDFIHHLVMLKKHGLHYNDDSDDDEDQVVDDINRPKTKAKVDLSWTNVDNDDLTAQVMLFFSAGFETTSTLLSFALYELTSSENGKTIQQKLREEVDRVMEEDGGQMTYAGLKKMELLDRILNETLRMYSPAGLLSRASIQPYIIPGTTIKLDVDTHVFIPTQALQHDEKYFPDPKRFNPDRFLPQNKDKLKHFSYLPFGDGPRFCIGERFAKLQAQMGLASLISKFEFDLCHDKTNVPLKFKKRSFVLATDGGIWLKARSRRRKL